MRASAILSLLKRWTAAKGAGTEPDLLREKKLYKAELAALSVAKEKKGEKGRIDVLAWWKLRRQRCLCWLHAQGSS